MLALPGAVVGAMIGYALAGEEGALIGCIMGLLIGGSVDATTDK